MLLADIIDMIEIYTTAIYNKWFRSLKDRSVVQHIQDRIKRMQEGNFGDHKSAGGGVWELRLRIGGGVRIYYTFDGKEAVLLLAGGNKRTQKDDIALARYIANNRGE